MRLKLPLLVSLVFLPTVFAADAPAAGSIAADTAPGHSTPLGTTFVDWDSLTPQTTPRGDNRAVFDNPTATLEKFEVHVATLLPGHATEVEHHASEEIVLIKEGELDVSFSGQIHHAGPGSLVFLASNDPQSLRNAGGQPATYYDINFIPALVHTLADNPSAQSAPPGILPSSVFDCNHLPATATKTGSTTNIVNSATRTFRSFLSHITTLNVGQSTAVDMIDSGEEFFVLKSGLLEATVNGITCRMKEGSVFYCAPNDKRTFRNIGATPAAYQVIKVVVSTNTPKPA